MTDVRTGTDLLDILGVPGGAPTVLDPSHPLVHGRTGRGQTIAVIDSGVHPRNPHIRVERIGRLIAIGPDGVVHHDAVDRLGHGTAVAAAIQEKAPDAELHVIRIFHDQLSTTVAALERALHCAIDVGATLANLSLGTTRPEHAPLLRAAVERACGEGTLIVAARDAGGAASWPGVLDGVAGVVLDASCPRDAVRLERGLWHASGYARPIPGVPPERNLNGVSFAVANVTGMLACALEGSRSTP